MRAGTHTLRLRLASAAVGLGLMAGQAPAATLTVVNVDAPDVGFNDPTPAPPVGGNPGTTVGAQRLNAVQHAADIWGSILDSDVPILIEASWDALTCDPNSGFIGFAGPVGNLYSDFPGAGVPQTWYVVAHANALAGSDLDPQRADISAQFNSAVGTAPCLTEFSWYYGLDNQATSDQFDLVTTALHEIAHGLGFLDFVNPQTGEPVGGQMDVYSRWLSDNRLGERWGQMTAAERAASAVSRSHLVWDGPAVTLAAPGILGKRPNVQVLAPAAIAGAYATQPAVFGASLTLAGVTADLVLADDAVGAGSDACEPIANGADLAGKIAMIDRGSCFFTLKVKNAQDAGAVGVIVVNNAPGGGVFSMGGEDPTLTIPAVMISFEDGNTLRAKLLEGVEVTLGLDALHWAGADDAGKVLLYAPNPVEPGSSVVHWDLSAIPDLLMEPLIPSDIPQDGDLAVELFRDIGWPLIVPIEVENLSALSAPDGIRLTWGLGVDALRDLRGVAVQRATAREGPYELRTAGLLTPAAAMSYTDPDVEPEVMYWYRLLLVGAAGDREPSPPVGVTFTRGQIRTALVIPLQSAAGAPIDIRYTIAQERTPVRLEVYDVAGRHLRSLDQGWRGRGEHRTAWDRLDARGDRVARGVYVVQLVAGQTSLTRKVVLVRR
jgi:PA domain-containing protein/flagellar hook capping protein FlgD